ncbi:MAG: hypothetical protein HWE26_06590 [Alteromonadaceae bacterium]|nr:hypothetical protein [Alteromonadaceae bacterium]
MNIKPPPDAKDKLLAFAPGELGSVQFFAKRAKLTLEFQTLTRKPLKKNSKAMLRNYFVIRLLLLLLLFSSKSTALETTIQTPAPVKITGLSCAEPAQSFIPLLGRGSDLEMFLTKDLQQELVRQEEHSELLSLVCTDKAIVKGASIDVQENGEIIQALSKLLITFPLTLKVKNRTSLIILDVKLHYLTENLESVEERTTELTFEVLTQR